MAEEATAELRQPVAGPAPFSWITELVSRLPAYTLMSGLFIYWILIISPQREAWWWGQLEKMTNEHREMMKTLEQECSVYAKENNQLLHQIERILAAQKKPQQWGVRTPDDTPTP